MAAPFDGAIFDPDIFDCFTTPTRRRHRSGTDYDRLRDYNLARPGGVDPSRDEK